MECRPSGFVDELICGDGDDEMSPESLGSPQMLYVPVMQRIETAVSEDYNHALSYPKALRARQQAP